MRQYQTKEKRHFFIKNLFQLKLGGKFWTNENEICLFCLFKRNPILSLKSLLDEMVIKKLGAWSRSQWRGSNKRNSRALCKNKNFSNLVNVLDGLSTLADDEAALAGRNGDVVLMLSAIIVDRSAPVTGTSVSAETSTAAASSAATAHEATSATTPSASAKAHVPVL